MWPVAGWTPINPLSVEHIHVTSSEADAPSVRHGYTINMGGPGRNIYSIQAIRTGRHSFDRGTTTQHGQPDTTRLRGRRVLWSLPPRPYRCCHWPLTRCQSPAPGQTRKCRCRYRTTHCFERYTAPRSRPYFLGDPGTDGPAPSSRSTRCRCGVPGPVESRIVMFSIRTLLATALDMTNPLIAYHARDSNHAVRDDDSIADIGDGNSTGKQLKAHQVGIYARIPRLPTSPSGWWRSNTNRAA